MNNLNAQTAYVGSTEITQVRKGDRLVLAPNGNKLWYDSNELPSLDLRFAEDKSLVDATTGSNLVDFTRASSATYVGSDGLIKTATTNEARFDHDPTTGESLGLLVEEQRSNLLLNSGTLATQDVTVTAVAHTLSFYGSGTVTLSGTHTATVVGTGAYPARTKLTFTPTAGTLTVTVSATVEYANLEIGSFATSYIPTTGSTVTRAADVASITGSNFSSWYRQDEGTVFVNQTSLSTVPQDFATVFQFNNTTVTNFLFIRKRPGFSQWVVGGSGLYMTRTISQPSVLSVAYKTDDAAFAAEGTLTNDNSCTIDPNKVELVIGSSTGSAAYVNGTIRRLTYWPARLPDSTLQTITQ
jgi:hypothetical protein